MVLSTSLNNKVTLRMMSIVQADGILYFPNSFKRYSTLKNERLFEVVSLYVKRWIYKDGIPFEEIYEVKKQIYVLL